MSKNTKINSKMIAKIPTQGNDVTTIGTNTVATNHIQDLAITTNKIASKAATADKIGDDAIPYITKHSKNYIINGDMRISQRGTSFASIGADLYSVDRFRYSKVGSMVHTASQDTDVPTFLQANYLFQNSLRFNLTTPQNSLASTDYNYILQGIEGYNFANIAQKSFTISFWVKATTVGTYCVAFRNASADRSYVAEYTVSTTNTWEYKTITVSASPSAGTWNYTNGVGLTVNFTIAAGTSFQTTPNAWQTGNFLSTSNQVNGVATGSTDFRITGVMLNEGSIANSFSLFGKDIGNELVACQRYYRKSYNMTIVPGSATSDGAIGTGTGAAAAAGMTTNWGPSMRANPTATLYNPVTGSTSTPVRGITGATNTATAIVTAGANGIQVYFNSPNQDYFNVQYAAEAEF